MAKPLAYASLLLITTALVAPPAFAQSGGQAAPAGPSETPQAVPEAAQPEEAQEAPEVSVPGGEEDIVVRGRAYVEPAQQSLQVLSVLSTADIARTGAGDIAGALGRVTGLSVVGNGFVYVRGLGDRYSLALLNGSPLPSPEPLKRVVPLDIFPTSVVASSLVQKSYSVNFPGEFGGGVINLTTKSIPTESFITVGAGVGYDTYTTGQLGYTYFGSDTDWTGFDNGQRDRPPALRNYIASGQRISQGGVDTATLAQQLVNSRQDVVFRNNEIPVNWSASISGGHSFDVGDATVGVIANFAYSNKWRTRQTTQQTPATFDLSALNTDFLRTITDNRIMVNALVGYGVEWGENKVRWTNVYIRDTLKQARLGLGKREVTFPGADFLTQDTAWFERQLVSTQLVGELKPLDNLTVDLRGGFANSQRESPFESTFEYFRSNRANDPYGQFFVNNLNNGNPGNAEVAFSNLNEDLWSAGVDVGYRFNDWLRLTGGYYFSDTQRRTERRDFLIFASGGVPQAAGLLRPDLLISRGPIDFYGIKVIEDESNPVFDATLRNHAGYLQANVQVTPEVNINAGVRYEQAKQTVSPVQVYNTPVASLAATNLDRDYFLPAATLTYQINDKLQVRLSGSKTIARPQFRELIFQPYFDPDSNRLFRGNPLLIDSQLTNYEGRAEWYFAREQRLSASGFFKKINNPIETFASVNENGVVSSFANAPSAILYGGEFELTKHFNLDASSSPFFQRRRIVLIGNYTYTKSKIRVGAGDTAALFPTSLNRTVLASELFNDGVPLTGQSDHIVNVEFGLEDRDGLSQQTFLITYASDRVTNRGASGQPDIIERPGLRLDFVARQGVTIAGIESELKIEARNLTGTKYREFQTNGQNIVYYNRYDQGRVLSLGWSMTF
ncbi:TonB-dependent receptor [Sphingomonas sp. ID1715]|uniref:TonB-dependent receptor domain-containing protein n=1 Tax=Sphingomonas sp. ID1715 TaxID=1656898 RepID=UPI0014892ABE|nr:TonB-dependent receptor [Sphingomonas sp. ID1715]NNM76000.1 TonB-dependent receptor [Sphingomonas sp. ID1715]